MNALGSFQDLSSHGGTHDGDWRFVVDLDLGNPTLRLIVYVFVYNNNSVVVLGIDLGVGVDGLTILELEPDLV